MHRPDNSLLRQLPSVSDLLARPEVRDWLDQNPRRLVVDAIRDALGELRSNILNDQAGRCGSAHVRPEAVLSRAEGILLQRCSPHICRAINATGILLHTALGRAVWPACVVDDIVTPLKGYATLAIDRQSGKRSERDNRVEAILCELTGAEAATVVNNNAGATLLVLAALCAGREVIVSRGQLIEIGGSFRLPDVMAQSGAQMVEVGATNRTHLRDYQQAIGEQTAAIFRAHPSNFRIVGFASQVATAELAELAHSRNILCIDDLGAGALVDLRRFGLGYEPTVQESLSAGADVALFSGDKLIGASQCGILVGRAEAIQRVGKHPLARALRPDKSCLMVLERTLALFRDPDRLARQHPLYRMLAMEEPDLRKRAESLARAIGQTAPSLQARPEKGSGYLGSGSLPDEALPGWVVRLSGDLPADQLATRLRMDPARVFCRIDSQAVVLDVRTLLDGEAEIVAAALGRCAGG
jgi:L-seryl-tRNA(Ser) seleniumtransferase